MTEWKPTLVCEPCTADLVLTIVYNEIVEPELSLQLTAKGEA